MNLVAYTATVFLQISCYFFLIRENYEFQWWWVPCAFIASGFTYLCFDELFPDRR